MENQNCQLSVQGRLFELKGKEWVRYQFPGNESVSTNEGWNLLQEKNYKNFSTFLLPTKFWQGTPDYYFKWFYCKLCQKVSGQDTECVDGKGGREC